jgi:hypothetical protein
MNEAGVPRGVGLCGTDRRGARNTLRIDIRGKAEPLWVLDFDAAADPVRLESPSVSGVGEKSMWRKDHWYILLGLTRPDRIPDAYKSRGGQVRASEVYLDMSR